MLGRMWFNVTVVLTLGLLVGWSVCFVDFSFSDRRHEYVQDGDIMLGVLLSVHVYDERRSCGTRVRDKGVVKMAEAIKYEVDRLNIDLFAGRLHLGFVMLDDCASSDTALGQALRFMPLDRYVSFQNCDAMNSGTSESLNKVTHTSSGNLYKVIGVIGPESSPRCLAVANVLGMFGLPQLSPTATSDQLSDKDKYPYFTRLVPPDRGQTLALLSLLLHFGWSHVVTVYSRGAYGESAEEQFTTLARQHSICVDLSLAISKSTKHDTAVDVLRRVNGSRARVLVLFADQEEVMLLFTIAFDMDMLRRVVWIGSDGLGMNLYNLRHNVASVAVGSLSFTLAASSAVPARFTAHLSSLSPATTHNPWLLEMLEDFYDCHVTNGTSLSSVDCTPKLKHIIRDWALNFNVSVLSTFIDTVTVLGHAIHSLVQTHCPAVLTGNYSLATLSDCLSSGSRLLDYIRQTEINGLNGHISFDRFGDGIGVYHLINFQRLPNGDQLPVVVGEWDMRTHQLTVNDSLIQWNYAGTVDANGVPLSACGHECAAGEVHSYFRDSCCWQCRKCKSNEITVDNTTHCFACPFYTWPDSNVTECVPLTAQVVSWQHPAIVTVLGLGVLGLVYCTVVFIAYVSHWQARLIKATSRELSFLMLGGVALQYALVWCVCAQPSQFSCSAKYAGFNVSFTLVYATLLVRTNRIYRIFRAGQRTRRLPMCSSPATQVLIVGLLTFVQVILNTTMMVVYTADVARHQPSPLEPHVELVCVLPLECLFVSLGYNLLLICLCCFYAFRSRRLPDNFNESRYICLCVYTTLVIWLAFLPTYFTATRALYRTLLLSCGLLVNATALLTCLFTPKLYAIYRRLTEGSESAVCPAATPSGTNFIFPLSSSKTRLSLPMSSTLAVDCLSDIDIAELPSLNMEHIDRPSSIDPASL